MNQQEVQASLSKKGAYVPFVSVTFTANGTGEAKVDLDIEEMAVSKLQPGKTQTINFYNINDCLYFVDLPGYGYAKVSEEIKAKWGKMIERYLMTSKMLRVIFLLIDIRHEPSQNDKDMYNFIVNSGFNPIIIATKMDKISKGQLNKHVNMIKKSLKVVEGTPVIPFSAQTKQGRDELWEMIDEYVEYFSNN